MLRPAPTVFALFLIAAAPAHADLYRWVDPDTGSVKLSTLPPSDPRINAELVPYRGVAPPPKPAAAAPPATPAAQPAAGATQQPASVAALEEQLHQISSQLAAATPQDLANNTETMRRQLVSYEALRAQLDRLDPAGAQRRAADATTLIERLRKK